jgi:short-subunit dehydrogenase
MNYKKKGVLIYGGTGGIGLEVCKKFASENFEIFLTFRSSSKLKLTKFLIKKLHPNVNITGIKCDVTNEKDIINCAKITKRKNINYIINCVGFFEYDGYKKTTVKNLIKNFTINTLPTILINKHIDYYKTKTSKLFIITVGSSSCYDGFFQTISYCSSKHALLGAIRSINKELINKNILNICVNPGSVKTKMGKKIKNQNYQSFIDAKEIAFFIFGLIKLNSIAYVEDIWIKRQI